MAIPLQVFKIRREFRRTAHPTYPNSLAGVSEEVKLYVAKQPGARLLEAVRRLLPQLSSCAPPTAEDLSEIVAGELTSLIVAEVDGEIVGMTTLVIFRLPTGLRAWVEDVVVDTEHRSRGLGGAMLQEALRLAAVAGARTVDLTSRASRVEANRLYESAGAERRETNVYRFKLESALGG